MNMSITDVAQQMRLLTHANVSSLDGGQVVVFIAAADEAIEKALVGLIDHNAHIRSDCVDSRYIIFPTEESTFLGTEINDVVIDCMSRIEAAAAYFTHLRATTNGAINFDLSISGKLNVPMYDDFVSLSPRATLLGHLIQLLGCDRDVAFSSRRGQDGHWRFWFCQ